MRSNDFSERDILLLKNFKKKMEYLFPETLYESKKLCFNTLLKIIDMETLFFFKL